MSTDYYSFHGKGIQRLNIKLKDLLPGLIHSSAYGSKGFDCSALQQRLDEANPDLAKIVIFDEGMYDPDESEDDAPGSIVYICSPVIRTMHYSDMDILARIAKALELVDLPRLAHEEDPSSVFQKPSNAQIRTFVANNLVQIESQGAFY